MPDPETDIARSLEAVDEEALDPMFDPAVVERAVDVLAALADGGRALELGIGTGRIALPLAARGVEVHGIDFSTEAIERLRAKPGGDAIAITLGDFSTVTVAGTFRVAYLVYNTIMNLTTQSAQVSCFRNVARHLEPGGRFVIEVGVPALRQLPPGEPYVVFEAGDRHWGVDEYDVANQGLVSHHFQGAGSQFAKSDGTFRYVWPSELDLMAELAGLELRERWDGWTRAPFTSESRQHVSVWQRPHA
jgi:SAM-dependent methyltransferase